ncbi:Aspyridones efflux apdF [Hyphodiscus hymeniophilus]|uniref:Aspyridones efflux apdF n=1 Tax=Hyphodiscus hymeniophilus TaxID=353542 RepID=A0A9P6SQZ9_9HELO|nr:Aspyridones efflux apdF [Hyphodiscus hymeniophilus]
MGNKEEEENSSNNETIWTAQDRDDEETREGIASVVPKDPNHDIPNGGSKAWLQVLGSFFLFFNSWGIINTFGVYQTFYETYLPETPSNISWIGSIQAYLLLLIGIATGPMYDAGYFRALVATGSFLVVFGMMMTSLCTEYWQIMLAQALCIGVGCGCLFVPSVAIVSTYFSTKKALATGIAAAGSSLGGVLYPIVFHKLQPTIGFGWATRVVAFIMLGTLSISLSVMRTRILPAQKRAIWDLSAFKEAPFVFFTLSIFFGFMGLYIPFFYVQSYAIQEKITSPDLAFYMLSILNASSIFGRIIPNFIADKTGPLNVIIPCTLATSVLGFGWVGVRSTGGLVPFCILYGFFSGAFVSIPPTVIVRLSPSIGVVGTRMGMCFALGGLGLLCGSPVAGQLIKQSGFDAAIYFCGAAVAMGTVCMIAARVSKMGWMLNRVA